MADDAPKKVQQYKDTVKKQVSTNSKVLYYWQSLIHIQTPFTGNIY